MIEQRNPNEHTFEIHPVGAGERNRQFIQLPEGTIRAVSYTPADHLPLYDVQEQAPIRNIGLGKRRQDSYQEVARGPGGSLARPILYRRQEHPLELYDHGNALHVAEGDEIHWDSSLFEGQTEADPGGTLKITLSDKERAIRTYSPGDVVEIALQLYDDGGIHEVNSRFVWGQRSTPSFNLRGHGNGAVEAEVTVQTRLRSNIRNGYYTCEYVDVRDMGGSSVRMRPDPAIIIQVEPQGTPNQGPELRTWRFSNS